MRVGEAGAVLQAAAGCASPRLCARARYRSDAAGLLRRGEGVLRDPREGKQYCGRRGGGGCLSKPFNRRLDDARVWIRTPWMQGLFAPVLGRTAIFHTKNSLDQTFAPSHARLQCTEASARARPRFLSRMANQLNASSLPAT